MDPSTTDLIGELLATKAFECSRCQEILHPPTKFIPEIGNICWFCTTQTRGSSQNLNPFPNRAIDALLEKMLFPCPFQVRGCSKRFRSNEILIHKNSCKYRQEKCLFSPLCKWEGNIEEFLRHLSIHKEAILKPQDGRFVIKNTISANKEVAAILLIDKATFVFRLLVDHVSNKIWYKLYDLENRASKYKISIKHIGRSVNNLQTSCTIVQKVEAPDFNKSEATEVDLTTLETVIEPTDTYKTVIKIKPRKSLEKIDDDMLHHFECPVCKNFMKPPIYQCVAGHSLCNTCKPRLERCPTCRANFANTRNFSLESLTSRLHYPCAYHDHGCNESAPSGEIVAHEQVCTYKPFTCFFQGCLFKGNYDTFTNHLQKMHEERVFSGQTHHFTMAFCMDKHVSLKRYAMLFDNKIFQVSYKQSLDYTYWGVNGDFSENPEEEYSYIYEVCLTDTRKPEKKIIRTDTCLRSVSDEDLFRKSLSLPNNIVMSFSNNKMINFHIKVEKKFRDRLLF